MHITKVPLSLHICSTGVLGFVFSICPVSSLWPCFMQSSEKKLVDEQAGTPTTSRSPLLALDPTIIEKGTVPQEEKYGYYMYEAVTFPLVMTSQSVGFDG